MLLRLVLWNVADSKTTIEELRRYLRDESVDQFEEVPIREGDVFRFDPETTRGPKAGPDGLTMVAVGAPRGSYEPRGSF